MLNIKVNRQLFLKSLQIVEKAISENKIRPVIGGLYLEAKENRIFMRGTNLELTINSVMSGEIISEGRIVFPYSIVDEYLRQIGNDTIEILEEEGKIVINTDNAMSEFSIYDAADYPVLKGYDSAGMFKVSPEVLSRAFEKARISADISGENIAMNCIRMEIEYDKLKTIATDTFRMVYYEENIENTNTTMNISIPLKTIDSILKIVKLVEINEIYVKYEGNQIILKAGETDIISRVIELEFPNYKSVLGSISSNKKVHMKTDDFISLLKRVQIFARNNLSAKNGSIFSFVGNKLTVRAISENAKVKEEIETIKEGDDLKISLNVKFLLDFATMVEKDIIELNLNGSNNPVLMKSEGDSSFIYLTMPLALTEE